MERVVVEGGDGFVDEFDDGCRACAPTDGLRDLFGSRSAEIAGSLSLNSRDGAATTGTLVRRDWVEVPMRGTRFSASFRPQLPQLFGEGYGIFLWQSAFSAAGGSGVLFGIYSFPDPADRASLPESCREAPLVIMARTYLVLEDYAVECEPIEASMPGAEVVLRADLGTDPATLDYSLDGENFTTFAGQSWATRVTPRSIGVFAQGEVPGSFTGLALAAGIERAPDESIQAIDGALSPSRSSIEAFSPSPAATGTFRMEAAAGADVREQPASLILETNSGALWASATGVHGRRRVDAGSGRPILGPQGFSLGSRNAFGARCDWMAPVAAFDVLNCGPTHLKSQGSTHALYANLLAGNGPARLTLQNFFTAGVPVPLVRLEKDPCDPFQSEAGGCSDVPDGGPTSGFGGLPGPGALYPNRTFNQVLTDAQEALLGCGSFWGAPVDSDCEVDGVRVFRSEASALLESMLRPEDWVATNGLPQPGTIGYAGEGACERETENGPVRLPGCRGPGDTGYDPLIDGCTGPGPIGCNAGDGGRPPADAAQLVIPATFGASAGQVFRSEMSALSWNLTMTLVAVSILHGSNRPDAIDVEDPYSVVSGKCSFAQPQHCHTVRSFTAALALEDDPAGPRRRWAWENGAEWRIESATGDFAPLAGGTIQHFGPVVADTAEADAVIGFLLVPEPGSRGLGGAAALALCGLGRRRSRTGQLRARALPHLVH